MDPIQAANVIERMDMGMRLFPNDCSYPPLPTAQGSLIKRIEMCQELGIDFHPGILHAYDDNISQDYWDAGPGPVVCDPVRENDMFVLTKMYCIPGVDALVDYQFEKLSSPICELFSNEENSRDVNPDTENKIKDLFTNMQEKRFRFDYPPEAGMEGFDKDFGHIGDLYCEGIIGAISVSNEHEPGWETWPRRIYMTPDMHKGIDELLVRNNLPRALLYSEMPADESSFPK